MGSKLGYVQESVDISYLLIAKDHPLESNDRYDDIAVLGTDGRGTA